MCTDHSRTTGPPHTVHNRAHRIGQYTETRIKPRHVIVKYLNYADKNAIMQRFRRSRSLTVDGAKLLLFADYSVEVMNKRKAFSPICSILYNNQLRFSLVYPATLRVQTHDGEQLTLTTPDEAEKFVSTLDTEMEHNSTEDYATTSGTPPSSSAKPQRSPTKPPYKRLRAAQKEDRSGHR